MTETTKTIFEKYEVRKTKEQKSAFIEFIKGYAEENSYECRIEEGRGLGKPRNIIVGNPDEAKVVYTAHYDTCPRTPFPNFITPKNIFIYILYQILIVAGFFAISFLVGAVVSLVLGLCGVGEDINGKITTFVVYITYLGLFLLLLKGPANLHTANDNTSGVTVLTDMMKAIPSNLRSKVAFIFFDLEEAGMVGSSAYMSAHKDSMKNKLLINFDCVSDGKNILFVLKKGALEYRELIASSFEGNEEFSVEIVSKGAIYPSDQAKFPLGVGVASLKKSKKLGILYMNRIHTAADTVYQEENISYLVDCAVKLCEEI